MDTLNIIFYGVVFFLVVYLILHVLPVIMLVFAVIWLIIKCFKGFNRVSKNNTHKVDDNIKTANNNSEKFSDSNVIDVEYREVK